MISIKDPKKVPQKDPDVWALRAPIKIVLYDFNKRCPKDPDVWSNP